MAGPLMALRVMVSFVLGLAFFITLALGAGLNAVHHSLLSPGFYTQQLDSNHVYERIYTDVLPDVVTASRFYGGLNVSQADQLTLLRRAIPPSFVQARTEEVVGRFLSWLKGGTGTLDATVDLRPLKPNARNVTLQYIGERVDAAPTCTTGQGLDMTALAQGVVPSCVPAGVNRAAARQLAIQYATPRVEADIAQAPDQLDLVALGADQAGLARQEFMDRLSRARTAVRNVDAMSLPVTIGVLAGIALLLALVHLPGLRGSVMWVGVTALLSGAVIAIVALVARSVVPPRLEAYLLSREDISPRAMALVTDTSRSAVHAVSADVIAPAVITLVIGAVLVVAALLLPRYVSARDTERLRHRRWSGYLHR